MIFIKNHDSKQLLIDIMYVKTFTILSDSTRQFLGIESPG